MIYLFYNIRAASTLIEIALRSTYAPIVNLRYFPMIAVSALFVYIFTDSHPRGKLNTVCSTVEEKNTVEENVI